MIGQTLSHYKILEKLGEGGMGVVYKAHDTELDRDVALKFLPHHITVNEAERARFLQEARAAAVLNHPNICTVHAIEKTDDQQFIVMEYVDGKTLRQRIVNGELKIDNCIAFATQIGEALQEAHSKGIVHRDVKTDNIMVNSKNQAKVMDFGLAKLKGSLKLTKTSSTAGTLAYMAPEQIEGREVDARSDIFSFGVVLYEMLTGHLPFRGEHEAAMMYSILNEEPTPVQSHLPDISSELVHVLNRALEKDPEDRYQSVAEMVIDLRRMKKETTKVTRHVGQELTPDPAVSPARPKRASRKAVWSAVSVVIVIIVAVASLLLSRGPELNPDMKFRVLHIPLRNIQYGNVTPDGNWLVFPAQDDRGKFDIYLMNIPQGQIKRVTNDSSFYMFSANVSPDAGTILYSRLNSSANATELVRVPSLGGQGKTILDSVLSGEFSNDGRSVYYVVNEALPSSRRTIQLWMCDLNGSGRRLLMADTITDRLGVRMAFAPSGDDRSIAWTKNFAGGYTEIMIRDLKTGVDRQLTFDRKLADDPRYTPTGHIVYGSNRGGNVNLWMIPSSGGESVQLTRGSGPDYPTAFTADAKKLLYGERQDVGHIKIANVNNGAVRQLTVDDRMRGDPSISPSGKFIAFASQDLDAVSDVREIYVMDSDGGNVHKFTDDPNFKTSPAWSPDEKWITYSARPAGEPAESSRVYLVRTDQPGQSTMVGKGKSTFWFSKDHFMVFDGAANYIASPGHEGYETFSRDSIRAKPILDGKYVAFYDGRSGREGWSITTTSSYRSSGIAGAKRFCGRYYGTFAHGGKEFYYWDYEARELHRVRLPGGRDERVKGTFPGLFVSFDIRSDGEEIVYTEHTYKRRFVLIENVFK